MYQICPMDKEYARVIMGWSYEGPYAVYSFADNDETRTELVAGSYLAVLDAAGMLCGFFCMGEAARIPAGRRVYQNTHRPGMLDIGLGLAPDRVGRGEGRRFLEAGKRYLYAVHGAVPLRLTVAQFNRRAIKVYEAVGFAETARFMRPVPRPGVEFMVMVCLPA